MALKDRQLTIACTRTAKSAARSSLCFLLPVMRGVTRLPRGGRWATSLGGVRV